MWGPSRAKKGLDLCPEQGKDLSLSHLLAADLSRSFPIRRAFLDYSPRDRSRGFLLHVTLHREAKLEGRLQTATIEGEGEGGL